MQLGMAGLEGSAEGDPDEVASLWSSVTTSPSWPESQTSQVNTPEMFGGVFFPSVFNHWEMSGALMISSSLWPSPSPLNHREL